MARKKKKKKKKTSSRATKTDSELDAWIDREATSKRGTCSLCEPKVLAELNYMEKRLRQKRKRVSMRAIWRRLATLKLIDFRQDNMGKNLQRQCHLKFYKYLKGLE